MNSRPLKRVIYLLKVLLASFAIAVGMVILFSVVGHVSGSEALMETSTSRAVMLITMLFALPICFKFMK